MTRDFQYSTLFEFVHFEYLSVGSIRDFGELISNSFDILTIGIWNTIVPRLLMSSPRLRFFPRDDDLFDGIFSYLTKECGGNIHEKGIIEVSASSIFNSHFSTPTMVDSTTTNCFATNNIENSELSHENIQSAHEQIAIVIILVRGRLKGGDDGETWSEMDSRRDITELTGLGKEKCYTIRDSREVRMIRIRETGLTNSGRNIWS
jgi:hypothetical protein